jgi:cytochrome c-type biogenesis protein CcmE
MIENNGIQYKILLNDMLAESKSLIMKGDTNTDLVGVTEKSVLAKNVDPLETLMTRMQTARNRKEKRRLLAEYNH